MKRGKLIFNTMLLMVLPVLSSAETLDRNELTQPSLEEVMPSSTVQEQKNRMVCHVVGMWVYNIMEEKYRKIPLKTSTFYNKANKAGMEEVFGKSLPTFQILTKAIYDLPYVEDLKERQNQLKMVEYLVVPSCAITLTLQ